METSLLSVPSLPREGARPSLAELDQLLVDTLAATKAAIVKEILEDLGDGDLYRSLDPSTETLDPETVVLDGIHLLAGAAMARAEGISVPSTFWRAVARALVLLDRHPPIMTAVRCGLEDQGVLIDEVRASVREARVAA